jgi:RNA polymerase sigma-70 factor (ECF subfamily)
MASAEAIVEWIPRLRRYARALTGDAVLADDLVQDTLARAIEKFALWRAGSDLRAWLFSVMHNTFVNQLRARHPTEALEGDDLEARPRVSDGVLIDLEKCLRGLPAEQREIILLIGLEEMSYAEAAQALGVPQGTVMSRLSRARARLAALMAGEAPSSATLRVVK